MKLLRAVLSGICFAIFGIGGVFIGTIIFPVICMAVKKTRQRAAFTAVIHYAWQLFVFLMRLFRLIDLNIKKSDLAVLKNLRGTVVAATHPSLIDIVILISLIPRSVCIVKSSLAHNFWMKFIIRKIYLVNDDPETFIREAADLLENGFNVIVFPEGTRTDFKAKTRKIHRGFAHIAVRAKAAVLPILIRNDPLILGKGQLWYQMGSKTSVYGIYVLPFIIPGVRDGESFHKSAQTVTDLLRRVLFS